MSKDEALKLALEALETVVVDVKTTPTAYEVQRQAITAIHEALAQPEQEPVAMRYDFDGYGWLYIDNGSGSNWREKIKNAEPLYTAPPQPKPEQKPVAWRNAAIRVGEDLCSVGPFGYYDMTAKQWLDWALSVVTVHAPPPQRKPLPPQSPCEMTQAEGKMFKLGWLECEAAHGIKGKA